MLVPMVSQRSRCNSNCEVTNPTGNLRATEVLYLLNTVQLFTEICVNEYNKLLKDRPK